MPQIQILPEVPSIGGEIGRALGTGLGQGIAGSISNYFEQKQNRNEATLISQALEGLEPGAGAFDIIKAISGLPIRQESKKLYGGLAVKAAAERFSGEREDRLVRQELNDRYNKRISDINAEMKLANRTETKRLKDQKTALQKEQARNQRALREGRRPIFDLLEGFGEESPYGEFEEIDREAVKVPPAKTQEQKPKRKLTPQVAKHFFEKAGRDANKAKQMAFEQGFE